MSSCPPSQIVPTSMPLRIDDIDIRQDAHRRYCLNDLHRAAGGEERHRPAEFLRRPDTVEIVAALEAERKYGPAHTFQPVETIMGRNGGTYVCRELVYAYAMWVSPAFHLKVIRTFDALVTGGVGPRAQALPQDYEQALEALLGKVRENRALAAENAAKAQQIEAQRSAVEFLDRYVEAKSTKCIRDVAKVLGLKERAFIAQLEADGVLFRQGRQLRPTAEYQHRGYFEVKTGEANKYAFVQTRFTPEGVAWAAQRYGRPSTESTRA